MTDLTKPDVLYDEFCQQIKNMKRALYLKYDVSAKDVDIATEIHEEMGES